MIMVKFKTIILKFNKKGEKTGWSYIEIPADIAQKIYPNNKKSFRVKGKLDNFAIEKTALLPMGEGAFILPMNGTIRKGIHKNHGAMVTVEMEIDKRPLKLNSDLLDCLADEPEGKKFFLSLAKSHQNYFSKWIESAKTDTTKAKRIAQTINAMCKKQNYGEMIRSNQKKNLA
jgi:hypothetical protein